MAHRGHAVGAHGRIDLGTALFHWHLREQHAGGTKPDKCRESALRERDYARPAGRGSAFAILLFFYLLSALSPKAALSTATTRLLISLMTSRPEKPSAPHSAIPSEMGLALRIRGRCLCCGKKKDDKPQERQCELLVPC